ncbi:hypothetical protein [Deinococcus frigens]|nr:hypothetical protein [Deinococcus frigens]
MNLATEQASVTHDPALTNATQVVTTVIGTSDETRRPELSIPVEV